MLDYREISTETKQQCADLLQALCLALPFVEDALYDESYKPERVQKVIDTIKQAIEKATA